jgi:hypothetical protein
MGFPFVPVVSAVFVAAVIEVKVMDQNLSVPVATPGDALASPVKYMVLPMNWAEEDVRE